MARLRTNFEGGRIYPKHSTIGSGGAVVPANSEIGPYSTIAPNVAIASGTVVGDGIKVRKGAEFGSRVKFGKDAQVRGTPDSPVLFGEGIEFGDGAELRHCHFARGVRFTGSAKIEHCILPSDTVFADRSLITIVVCKKLKVSEPYPWVTAEPDGNSEQ